MRWDIGLGLRGRLPALWGHRAQKKKRDQRSPGVIARLSFTGLINLLI
jgi:hypothetical protein